MPFNNFYKKIAAIESFDITRETMAIIRENEETILNLVRGQLGSKGIRGDGKFTRAKYGNTYRDSTVLHKEREGIGLGKKTDFVTMFMSGEFYASLKLVTAGTTFTVTSSVPYFEEIQSWNNGKLTELDRHNLIYLRDTIIVPELQRRFRQKSAI